MTELRALILEDSPTDAELAVFELERTGLRVAAEAVATRDAFIAALRTFRPDVVLADYSLPSFDGKEALQLVTEPYPHLPVIIVTGALGDELAIELIKAGARDYVLKSNLMRLGPAVMRALDNARAVQAREQAERALAEEREQQLATLEQRVEERTAQLRALAFELAKAEERERHAIATDLHDGLGQTLAIARIKLSGIAIETLPAEAAATLGVVEKLIDQSNRAMRSLVDQLSPPVLSDLGLAPALEWLAEQMERDFDLRCNLSLEPLPESLDAGVSAILFRVVRELLVNIVKHADVGATPVEIAVAPVANGAETRLQIVVADRGRGFDPAAVKRTDRGGFGLMNVNERLAYIGGRIVFDSSPGRGTTATIDVPLQSAD